MNAGYLFLKKIFTLMKKEEKIATFFIYEKALNPDYTIKLPSNPSNLELMAVIRSILTNSN